ncbi:hypothetical protein GW17_00037441, partial [Ensete ventricosum]
GGQPQPSHLQGGGRLWLRPLEGEATRKGGHLQCGARRSDDVQCGTNPQRDRLRTRWPCESATNGAQHSRMRGDGGGDDGDHRMRAEGEG